MGRTVIFQGNPASGGHYDQMYVGLQGTNNEFNHSSCGILHYNHSINSQKTILFKDVISWLQASIKKLLVSFDWHMAL